MTTPRSAASLASLRSERIAEAAERKRKRTRAGTHEYRPARGPSATEIEQRKQARTGRGIVEQARQVPGGLRGTAA